MPHSPRTPISLAAERSGLVIPRALRRGVHRLSARQHPLIGLVGLLLLGACGDDGAARAPSPDTDGTDSGFDADPTDAASDAADELPADPLPDGAPCTDDRACAGGACLSPYDGFPGGFCTVRNCDSARDCTGDAACLRGAFNGNLCVPLCATSADCREGYDCVAVPGAGGAYCGPAWAGAALVPVCETGDDADPMTTNPFDERGPFVALRRFTFDVPPDATSFMVLPYSRRHRLFLSRLVSPSGTIVDVDRYAGYSFSPYTFQFLAPVLFPAGPQFVEDFESGTWTAEVTFEGSSNERLCWVVHFDDAAFEADDALLYLDMNLYLVGVPSLSAASAATSENYLAMLAAFGESLRGAGLAVGDVRYFDVTGTVRDRFTIIRDYEEAFELVRLARQPGPTPADLLSVNVFFIQGFAGDMSGTLGISAGIPGSAGLHGGPGGGLIFSSASLARSGARLVGQTLAHEVGHYLGLFHTTEFNFLGQDHLEDTPVCPDIGRGNARCPDFTNLMYPAAANRSETVLTPGQAQILRANPLTRSRPRPSVVRGALSAQETP
jgi:hypothetical protein